MSDHVPGASADARQQARAAAAAAAADARVTIVDVHDLAHLEGVSALLDAVWGRDPAAPSIVAPELLRAMEHAGNQVSAAFRGDGLVAATAALLGLDPDHAGRVHLHSHVTGVSAAAQGEGVGRAMKLHQRAWCLDRGITTVRWTFDPLVRRNAVFNLVKLGARIVAYREDVYGRMRDARNVGLPTDRAVASWELTERRVVLACEGRFAEPRLDALRGAGAEVALSAGEDGAPEVTAPAGGARLLLAQVPADIERLRASDPGLAQRWGDAFRRVVGDAIGRGYRVTGVTRDGWYALGREDRVEELSG